MSDPKPDIFVYKMTTDNGGAPCVFNNLLSLALCKPKIRKTAEPESLIFGFGGKNYQERLIYVACVTRKLEGPTYYRESEYSSRPDCIYRVECGKAVRKASAVYHADSDQRQKDVGLHFENAFVLLSNDFRYFGRKGTADYKKQYREIKRLIESLGQGHRRYHPEELRKELLALVGEIWKVHPHTMKIGDPIDDDYSRRCNCESRCVIC
jgi:hypothetical protein